jgi:lipoteichoic acid synthase
MDQTYEILGAFEEPFFAYIITMQSHGPFTNHRSGDDAFAFGPGDSRLFKDYILTFHEVDAAVGAFLDRLQEAGFLERTVVMIFGDHRSEASPSDLEEPTDGWSHERIPCLIFSPDLEPGRSSKVSSHLDLGPTLLHLLGLEDVDRWLGTSLLDSGAGTAVLVQHGKSLVLRNAPEGEGVVALEAEPYWKYLDYSAGLLHP